MPDTVENQQAYPQPPQQRLGVGFPLARIAAFFSLSCGAVLDLGICSYSGKGHSELGMLRKLWDILRAGDILLADRYMCAWHEIYLLKQRGIDTVTRVHHCRRVDFRCGERLAKGDHIVEWRRPGRIGSVRQVAHIGVGLLLGLVGERPARPFPGLARPHPLVQSLG